VKSDGAWLFSERLLYVDWVDERALSMTAPEKQMRLVIVGATGMVGGYACAMRWSNLPSGGHSYWAQDGRHFASQVDRGSASRLWGLFRLAEALSGQDAAVFCLGTYTGSVSDVELRTITASYAIEFARVLRTSSPTALSHS